MIFLLSAPLNAQVVWSENFDSCNDYQCCSDNCPGPTGCNENYSSGDATPTYCPPECGIRINSAAGRTGKGMRWILFPPESVARDNMITTSLGGSYSRLFFRWYMRESNIGILEHYDKLFRIWTNGGQIVPEWRHTSSAGNTLAFNVWDQSSSNHYIGSRWEYTVPNNTWHCYEVMLDLAQDQIKMWYDGVLQGTVNASLVGSVFSYFTIGGNASGHALSGSQRSYRDYDDIIVSTQYVGPSGSSGGTDVTPPAQPNGLRIE